MAQWVEIVVLGVVSLAALSVFWSTLRFGISPMPTSGKVRDALTAMLDPSLEGTVHELGAGWGTLAFAIARRCPKLTVIAHEGSPVPYLFCRLRKAVSGARNVELRFGDFLAADLRGARGVVTYLWTGGMQQLAAKFDRELPAGSFVLSHTFAWRGREPTETRTVDDLYRTRIYRYAVSSRPAERDQRDEDQR